METPTRSRGIDLLDRSSAILINVGQLTQPGITTEYKQTFKLSTVALHIHILSRSRGYVTRIWLSPPQDRLSLHRSEQSLTHVPVMQWSSARDIK